MKDIEEFVKNLKDDGIIRRIDELGRILIPVTFRNEYFKAGDTVYLQRIRDYIVLKIENEDNTAIKKTIDELGRIVINIEIRRDLDWNEKDAISVWAFKNYIIMKKFEEKCAFCKSTSNLTTFKGKLVCEKCKKQISKGS